MSFSPPIDRAEKFRCYLEEYEQKQVRVYFYNVRDQYWNLVEHLVTGNANRSDLNTALDLFPRFCKGCADTGVPLFAAMVPYMFTMLCQQRNIDYVKKLPDGETALAWFTCDIASAYIYDEHDSSLDEITERAQFIELLQNWTGKRLPNDFIPQLDKVAVLLYGQTCWDLLGCTFEFPPDNDNLSKVVFDITQANIPFAFYTNTAQRQDDISIPENMSWG